MTDTLITTLEQLGEVLEPEDKHKREESALWFLSLCEAEWLTDCNRLKDWAELLQDGIPPMKERWADVLSGISEDENPWPTDDRVCGIARSFGWEV